ncbi:DUF4136 domain-containing protein [Marinimicrobium alkaliphilum]|uniref:DUF4136 domain-containing protein n=1 Tax=Marinimicrobium alkaliphilum TaxID=2202654 RepID=UPI000DB9AB82|nr:DUF4136 domain-containing protein [Marinimicrobium alkaliphilum]
MNSSILRAGTLTALIAGLLLSVGCSSVRYEQDYRPDTTFERYQSFSWRSAESEFEDADMRRIQRLARTQLEAQGYQYQAEDGELLIDLNLVTRLSQGGSSGIGLSIGLPVGRHGSVGVGGSQALGSGTKEEAVIIADITERASNTILWRGTASGVPTGHFTLRNEARLSEVLSKLFAQFPPE